MIECDDNGYFPVDEELVNQKENYDPIHFSNVTDVNEELTNTEIIGIHKETSTDISKYNTIKISNKSNNTFDKMNKILQEANEMPCFGPIKTKRIENKDKIVPQDKTNLSKSSQRRSQSALSQNSKTAVLNQVLEERVIEESDHINTGTKQIVVKSKKEIEYIAPECVETVRSKNQINNNVAYYYSKMKNQNQEPMNVGTEVEVEGKTIESKDISNLRTMIEYFLDLDMHCSALAEEISAYKQEKKQYEELILVVMDKCNQERVACNDTAVLKQVKTFRPKPKETDILQTLTTVLRDESLATQLVKAIVESVPEEEKVSLKEDKSSDKKSKVKRVKSNIIS